jgi:hypothetical protein
MSLRLKNGDKSSKKKYIITGGEEGEKTLLAISDIEGCAESKILCTETNYQHITYYLNNPNNNIAFLGDYFDQGPGMIESIINIGVIKTIYENRVHIILGNRDINKFRLFYEAVTNLIKPDITDLMFNDWNGVTPKKSNILNEDDVWGEQDMVKKTETLIAKTYGAAKLLKNIVSELNEKKDKDKNENKKINKYELNTTSLATEKDALYILCSVYVHDKELELYFGNEISPFIENNIELIKSFQQNCRIVFNYGRLISSFQFSNKKVALMSHGGSYDKNIFKINKVHYAKIIIPDNNHSMKDNNDSMKDNNDSMNYFSRMETARLFFASNAVFGDDNAINLNDNITQINSIYDTFLNEIFKKDESYKFSIKNENLKKLIDDTNALSKSYFIINALGLNKNVDEGDYISPIASCGIDGCKGVKPTDPQLIQIFIQKGINYVLNGHIPHCTNVPIIYNRKGNNDSEYVVFISCDTSNSLGIPDEYERLDQLPLAFITEDKVGITSLNDSGKLDSSKTKGFGYKKNGLEPYAELIQEWSYTKTPNIIENTRGHQILEFPSKIENDKMVYLNTGDVASNLYAKMEITEVKTGGGKKSRRRKGKSGRVSKRRNKKMCKNMQCKRCG